MRSKNIEELTDAVGKIYCDHTVRLAGPAGNVDGQLEVTHAPQTLAHLSYGAPVSGESPPSGVSISRSASKPWLSSIG